VYSGHYSGILYTPARSQGLKAISLLGHMPARKAPHGQIRRRQPTPPPYIGPPARAWTYTGNSQQESVELDLLLFGRVLQVRASVSPASRHHEGLSPKTHR
jgi:hypothetical protein